MRMVLLGDGESPHLLKWARALAPQVDLWVASSRGFAPGFESLLAPQRLFALGTQPKVEGGNVKLLRQLPRLARWLHKVHPDWIHAHYLSSHGTLAWAATKFYDVHGRIIGSAWGTDVLVTPKRSLMMRWMTRRVLRACALVTSDSLTMAERLRELGAGEVMTFPFGLEVLPPPATDKDDALFFTNRGLEAIYRPERAIQLFADVASAWPEARLVVANDGSLRGALEAQVAAAGLTERVRFVGLLDADAQNVWYAKARWFISVPASDSVSVSVLEAMAHGCIPLLSDLPANHELVTDGQTGLILGDDEALGVDTLQPLRSHATAIARANRDWVAAHAMFPRSVGVFLARLRALKG
ncbi:MAG: glycosyltransferase [Burkholderiales bacterium]|nr:glycosyltransferase [Burkholderiales bacterium]